MVSRGKVRVNAKIVKKPAVAVGAGDVLTVVQGDRLRVVRIAGLPARRGPAAEASELYEESRP